MLEISLLHSSLKPHARCDLGPLRLRIGLAKDLLITLYVGAGYQHVGLSLTETRMIRVANYTGPITQLDLRKAYSRQASRRVVSCRVWNSTTEGHKPLPESHSTGYCGKPQLRLRGLGVPLDDEWTKLTPSSIGGQSFWREERGGGNARSDG